MFRFDPFEVEPEIGELRKNGRKIHLQEKPFQVLVALLEQRGRLVNRDALRQRLWPGDTFVDFDNGLNTAISKLREVLGDSAERHHYIETLPRRGYRFMAPVEDVGVTPAAIQRRELDIQKERIEPGIVVVKIAGHITLGSECQQIEWLIADLLSQKEERIIFDISAVNRIDSTGLGIIVVCSGRVKNAGGELRVAGAHGVVEHALKMTHVDHIVALYPTTMAAVKGFTRDAA
jgi:anti-anti-sigma factor